MARTNPSSRLRSIPGALAAAAALGMVGGAASAQPSASLGRFFGFDPMRVIVIDDDCGPVVIEDMNGDGLRDIVVVNNRKSRIEEHLQRAKPLTDEEVATQAKVNELPPSRWYERREISVAHKVSGMRAHDFDADGRPDLVYAGNPPEIVILRQEKSGEFKSLAKRRVAGLAATRDGIEIADVTGGPEPELLAIADGRIHVFPILAGGALGEPERLGSGGKSQQLIAFFVEDYDGNGMKDILGAIPEDGAPLRLWMQTPSGSTPATGKNKRGAIGPELRFEMPALREAEPVRFPGRAAASVGVIERASRRMALYDVTQEQIKTAASLGAEREVQAEVYTYPDEDAKDRAAIVADIDQDGLPDLVAADVKGNSLILHRQVKGSGLARGERFSAFKTPKALAAGQWDGSGPLEVFVLSEEEKAVGVSAFDASTGSLGFPQPVALATAGASPVAMSLVTLTDGPALAVVVQNKRDHTLEVHRPSKTGGDAVRIELTGVARPPKSMLAADIDHDGKTDLLLFTPNEPMVMVRSIEDGAGAKTLTDKTMPQFGLVQAAGPDNTALLGIRGDGRQALLIADKNYVRACEFDPTAGWRVIEQATSPDAATQFVGLTTLSGGSGAPPRVVAADKTGKSLIIMSRDEKGAGWAPTDRLRLTGFEPKGLVAGPFTGGGRDDLLCFSDDGFGVVRLEGTRTSLTEFDAWRSDNENRLEHEITVGDLNSDGKVDLVVLDAKEAYCQIFTLSANRKLHEATEFEVFQSRLFERGDGQRRTEPSYAAVDDVTGDKANDLILLVHDRVIVYPQMTSERK